MKNVHCTRCTRKCHEKDIYTIQQLQYRKDPSYGWSVEFLQSKVSEWDSLCEDCVRHYANISFNAWQKRKK